MKASAQPLANIVRTPLCQQPQLCMTMLGLIQGMCHQVWPEATLAVPTRALRSPAQLPSASRKLASIAQGLQDTPARLGTFISATAAQMYSVDKLTDSDSFQQLVCMAS